MLPSLRLFNLLIPMYPLCVATGFLIGTVVAIMLGKKIGLSENFVYLLMCCVEVGVIIGGKALFLLVNIKTLRKIYDAFGIIGVFTKTGFVFYGGLGGGILAVFFISIIKKASFYNVLSLEMTVTPLIHVFGRLGCFCSGCCYGKEWHGAISIYMHGKERFPVQLMEASFNLILFGVLLFTFYFKRGKYIVIPIYLIGYGSIRLFTELFRGDASRRFIGAMSVSSWISILCVLIGLFLCFSKFIRKMDVGNE